MRKNLQISPTQVEGQNTIKVKTTNFPTKKKLSLEELSSRERYIIEKKEYKTPRRWKNKISKFGRSIGANERSEKESQGSSFSSSNFNFINRNPGFVNERENRAKKRKTHLNIKKGRNMRPGIVS